jgi:hypothetical protein
MSYINITIRLNWSFYLQRKDFWNCLSSWDWLFSEKKKLSLFFILPGLYGTRLRYLHFFNESENEIFRFHPKIFFSFFVKKVFSDFPAENCVRKNDHLNNRSLLWWNKRPSLEIFDKWTEKKSIRRIFIVSQEDRVKKCVCMNKCFFVPRGPTQTCRNYVGLGRAWKLRALAGLVLCTSGTCTLYLGLGLGAYLVKSGSDLGFYLISKKVGQAGLAQNPEPVELGLRPRPIRNPKNVIDFYKNVSPPLEHVPTQWLCCASAFQSSSTLK